MIFIPIWAWFGFPEVARGCVCSQPPFLSLALSEHIAPADEQKLIFSLVFAGIDCFTFSQRVRSRSFLCDPRPQLTSYSHASMTGGYVTSVLKDAFCVPRPFSPPVQRLSVGSHALEYGFPSTHSSNALSMALFFGELLLRRNREGSWMVNALGVVGLVFFAWSITFGRLYTGMVSYFPFPFSFSRQAFQLLVREYSRSKLTTFSFFFPRVQHSKMDVRVGASLGVMVWLLTWLGEGPLERLVSGTRLTGSSSTLSISLTSTCLVVFLRVD